MMGDILAAAPFGIAVKPMMDQAICDTIDHAAIQGFVQRLIIHRADGQEIRQIIAVPVAIQVTFPQTHISTQNHAGHHAAVVQLNRSIGAGFLAATFPRHTFRHSDFKCPVMDAVGHGEMHPA